MSLKYYYEKELNKLYEEAHRFSQDYPEQAASLNLERNKANDPHVQRLLEGCAFLTAKIHQMVDDEADHLPEQLIQRLWPQLAEGFPSVMMVQALTQASLQKTTVIPAGTVLQTGLLGEHEKLSCKFTVTSPLNIAPITISEVLHHSEQNESLSISLLAENGWGRVSCDSVSLFIDTNSVVAHGIIHLISEGAKNLKIFADGQAINASGVKLSLLACEPEHCLNQQVSNGLYPQQLLFECFAFPEKMQVFMLSGLSSLSISQNTETLRFVFTDSARIKRTYKIKKEDFKLFVVPAINKYEHDCEPVSLDHQHHRYFLSADHKKPESVQVLSVISVKGTADLNLSAVHYVPLHKVYDQQTPYYVLQRIAQKGGRVDAYLSFNSDIFQKETISVKANVCNGDYPRRYIRPGSISFIDKQYEAFTGMSIVRQPTPYLSATNKDLSIHLLKQLRVLVEDIHTVEHLKTLLTLLNRSENTQVEKRINAIFSLEIYTRALIRRGVYYRVQGIRICLQEIGFTSLSDAYCFGALLHAFYKGTAMIGTVIETNIVCQPSEETFKWLSI